MSFTPIEGLLGGALIGLSAAATLVFHGRVAGVSGIFYGLFDGGRFGGKTSVGTRAITVGMYALGGFLVGAGTKISNGCTSGHGSSTRSLAAVGTFVAAAVAATTALHGLRGSSTGSVFGGFAPFTLAPLSRGGDRMLPLAALAACTFALIATGRGRGGAGKGGNEINTFLCGLPFGLGLAFSGMMIPSKVTGFLDVTGRAGAWDPTLAFVMIGGIFGNVVGQQVLTGSRVDVSGVRAPNLPNANDVNNRLLFGAALFGVGWSLCGLCPGPAIASLALPLVNVGIGSTVLPFIAAMAAGMVVTDQMKW